MAAVSMLPHVELGRNDFREDAPHFISLALKVFLGPGIFKVFELDQNSNSNSLKTRLTLPTTI